jgi:hypothetical protein
MLDNDLCRQAESTIAGLQAAIDCIKSGLALSSPDEISRSIWRATDAIGELAKHFPNLRICGTPGSPTGRGYVVADINSDSEGLARVLVVVSGGVAEAFCEGLVDVSIHDLDDAEDDPSYPAIGAAFTSLARRAGLVVQEQD